jgi:hypothetical protein
MCYANYRGQQVLGTVNINVSFEQLCFLVLGVLVLLTIIGGIFGSEAPRKKRKGTSEDHDQH